MQPPLITYYARVIDNLSGEEIFSSVEASKNLWFYGKCNGLEGGESEYIVEFDIWNNEPAFNAGTYDNYCANAFNCKFSVWPNNNMTLSNDPIFNLSQPFMYIRCITSDYRSPWKAVRYNISFEDIIGSRNSELLGVLQGNGDYTKIQTKIVLPPQTNLDISRYNFVLNFKYDYL